MKTIKVTAVFAALTLFAGVAAGCGSKPEESASVPTTATPANPSANAQSRRPRPTASVGVDTIQGTNPNPSMAGGLNSGNK